MEHEAQLYRSLSNWEFKALSPINYKHLKETFPVICHHFYSTYLHRDTLIILLEESIFMYMPPYELDSVLKAFFFFFLLLLRINQVLRFLDFWIVTNEHK